MRLLRNILALSPCCKPLAAPNSVLCYPYTGRRWQFDGCFNRRDLTRIVHTTLDDEVEGPDAHRHAGYLTRMIWKLWVTPSMVRMTSRRTWP